MSWDDLRYLEAVARAGTAQSAARELGVSPSTIYRRLAALEAEIGAACLLKGNGQAELTATGQALVEVAKHTKAQVAKVVSQSQATTDTVCGRVGLTTVEGMVPVISAPLSRLREAHPDLRVDLFISNSGPSVRRHEIDIAIGVMHRPPEELVGRKLFRIRFRVYGTAEAIAAQQRSWIVSGPPIEFTPEAAWERENAEDVAVSTGSRIASLELARRGVGVALLPTRLAALCPELIEVGDYNESVREIATRDAWLLVHPSKRGNLNVRAVMETLLKSFSDSQHDDD